jgi:hypothetical protein
MKMGISAYLVCETCKKRIYLGSLRVINFKRIIDNPKRYLKIMKELNEIPFIDRKKQLKEIWCDDNLGRLLRFLELLKQHKGHKIWYFDEYFMGDDNSLPWFDGLNSKGVMKIKKGWKLVW